MKTLARVFAVRQAMAEHAGSLTDGETAHAWQECETRWKELAAPWKGYTGHWTNRMLNRDVTLRYHTKDLFEAIISPAHAAAAGNEHDAAIGIYATRNDNGARKWGNASQVKAGLTMALMKEGTYRQLEQDVEIICAFLMERFSLDLTHASIQEIVEAKHAELEQNLGRYHKRLHHSQPNDQHTENVLYDLRQLEELTPQTIETLWQEAKSEFPAGWTKARDMELSEARRNLLYIIAGQPPLPGYSLARPPEGSANEQYRAQVDFAIDCLNDQYMTVPHVLRHIVTLDAIGVKRMQATKRDVGILCTFLDRKFHLTAPPSELAGAILSVSDQLERALPERRSTHER